VGWSGVLEGCLEGEGMGNGARRGPGGVWMVLTAVGGWGAEREVLGCGRIRGLGRRAGLGGGCSAVCCN